YSREDVVRLGPKRPPIAAVAWWDDGSVRVRGTVAGDVAPYTAPVVWPYDLTEVGEWSGVEVPGPRTSPDARAVGLAERAVLLEGALHVARVDRAALVRDARARSVVLDSCVAAASSALAGAHVECDDVGRIARVRVRVAAGDPLDAIVL